MKITSLLIIFLTFTTLTFAQEESEKSGNKLYLETAFTFSHFEQQVKSEIGGAKGDLIIDETNLSFHTAVGFHILKNISAGVYFRYDSGKRLNSLFNGFDSNGQTIISQTLGGDYSEIWIGPFAKFHYKRLFFSLGYGMIGSRKDDGRNDLLGTNGNAGNFTLDPSVAWIFNLGGEIPMTEKLAFYFGIEYRARYYNQRGAVNLEGNVVFGTQNFTPLVGVKFGF